MSIRMYDPKKDNEALHRIWQETGWISNEKREKDAVDIFAGASHGLVYDINGEAESAVLSMPGVIRHTGTDLNFGVITAVTASRIARLQGFTSDLVTASMLHNIQKGADVLGLGMFEQGYYNRFGFGTGPYENWFFLDPASLNIPGKPRMPIRIGKDDWDDVHKNRLARKRGHGSVNIYPADYTQAEMKWSEK